MVGENTGQDMGKTRLGRITGRIVSGCIAIGIFALAWAGIEGDRGRQALERAVKDQARLEAELAALRAERRAAENRVRRLSDGYLDLDLLDERARAVLGYARPDELVIRPVAR